MYPNGDDKDNRAAVAVAGSIGGVMAAIRDDSASTTRTSEAVA